jgi:hypothetical protein
MPGHKKYEPRHAKGKQADDQAGVADTMAVEPQPGTAAMAQGQPEAGIEPDESKPEQPGNVVTGGEALEEQQQNPDLDDTSGAHP